MENRDTFLEAIKGVAEEQKSVLLCTENKNLCPLVKKEKERERFSCSK